jgi:hypothetical protein
VLTPQHSLAFAHGLKVVRESEAPSLPIAVIVLRSPTGHGYSLIAYPSLAVLQEGLVQHKAPEIYSDQVLPIVSGDTKPDELGR